MSILRLAWRVPLIVLLTMFSVFLIAIASPWRRFFPRLQRKVRNFAFRAWGRGFARLAGVRLKVEGTPPTGRFLLVTNHTSYLDVALLGALVDAAFVAKADLRSWPGLGPSFAVSDTIFINRDRRRDVVEVGQAMSRALEKDLGVVFFPEGTSGRGDQVLRFKPSLFELPASRDLAVHWAVLHYRSPPGWPSAQEVICWWGDTEFLPHAVRLLQMPHLEATICFGSEPIHDQDRKKLAERLHTKIVEHFEPME